MKPVTLHGNCPHCGGLLSMSRNIDTQPNIAIDREAFEQFDRLGDDFEKRLNRLAEIDQIEYWPTME